MLYTGVDMLILAKVIQDDAGGYEATTPVELPVASVNTGNEGNITPVYKDGNIINFYPVGAEQDITIETQAISPDLLTAFFYGEEGADAGAYIDTGIHGVNHYALGFRFKLTDGSYTYYSYPKGTILINSKSVKSNDNSATAIVESIIFKAMPTIHKFEYNGKPCRKLIVNTNRHAVNPDGFKAIVWTPNNLLPVPAPILSIEEEAGTAYVVARAVRDYDTVALTTDGTTPTTETEPYTAPVAVNARMTVKAVECSTCKHTSGVAVMNVAEYVLLAPMITIEDNAGVVTVYMSVDNANAQIRYTLDGTEPTEESALYTEPLNFDGGAIIKAKSFGEGYISSETVEESIIVPLPAPALLVVGAEAQPNAGVVTLNNDYSEYAGVKVHYTLDGTEPTEESPILNTVTMTGDQILKAVAIGANYNPSRVVTFVGYENRADNPNYAISMITEQYGYRKDIEVVGNGPIWALDSNTGEWVNDFIVDKKTTYQNIEFVSYRSAPGCINSEAVTTTVEVPLRAPEMSIYSATDSEKVYSFNKNYVASTGGAYSVEVQEAGFPCEIWEDSANVFIGIYGNGVIHVRLESPYNEPSGYVEIEASGLRASAPEINII